MLETKEKICPEGKKLNHTTNRCNKIKSKKDKEIKKVNKKKHGVLDKLRKKKEYKIELSVTPRTRIRINKEIKKYKYNLLRGRNILFQLKNLADERHSLQFYSKRLAKVFI